MGNKVEFLIVGFGLAGACLARSFEKAGVTFQVIDAPSKSKASTVAAGMFNPVVFRRLLKSWMADEILPFAKDFYQELEKELSTRFYFEREYYKIIGSKEGEFWQKKASEEEVGDYIHHELEFPFDQHHISHEFGAGKVSGAGNVQLPVLIEAYKSNLQLKSIFHEMDLDYSNILESGTGIQIGELKADKIIFCEGSHAINNPWFRDLPWRLTKGEVLTIKVPDLDLAQMLNKNIFVLPLGGDLYRVGATYEWRELSETPTEKGMESLRERLEKILKIPYEIIDHKAGIRPVLADRRPVIGFHPNHPGIGIFNGLGTKGVMLGPYFANHFTEHILDGSSLNNETDLARFNKHLISDLS